jgi:glycosyltransferase involved in cell wall biosynthesis
MRLLIDGRPLVGHRTGIGVHVAEIAKRLDFDTPPTIATHTQIDDLSGLGNCAFRVDHAPNGILWQQFVLPSIDADVLWGPHGTLPARGKTPAVITLHDFTSITMPGRHRLKTILSFNLFIGRSIQRASRIAAVSRATAEEAVRGFGVSRAKIELVPNGVDEYFSPSPRRDEGDYILFVGTLEPRKGLGDLLETYASLPAPRPRLVLCGSEGWLSKMKPIDGVERTGYVDRARLRELYRGARLFVYPSHFEGFGIPPLEAMACGAPVITTRTGAIPEYAEGAAILIEPGDRVALREAMLRALGSPSLRRELGARAAERARDYRWERSARLMQQLFEDAARS